MYVIAGTIGTACYVGAYFATLRGWPPADRRGFPPINLIAAILVLVSLIDAWNLPSFLLEIFWGAISVYGLLRQQSSAGPPLP